MSPLATKPRILLVDDDTDILLALSDYLRRAGFEVDPVKIGVDKKKKSTIH